MPAGGKNKVLKLAENKIFQTVFNTKGNTY